MSEAQNWYVFGTYLALSSVERTGRGAAVARIDGVRPWDGV